MWKRYRRGSNIRFPRASTLFGLYHSSQTLISAALRATVQLQLDVRLEPERGADAGRLRARLLALLAATVLALALPATATASPARFTYELCDSALPGGGLPALSFTVNPIVQMGYFANCQESGGSVGISEWGHAAATFAMLSVGVPETPGGFVETETISAGAYGLGAANNHSFVYEQPWPIKNELETARTFFVRRERQFLGNGGSFTILLNCDGNVGTCEAGPVIFAHYIAATEVDPNPPTLTGLNGSLLGGGTIRGHQSLEVESHDLGGGVSKNEVLVNGIPAAHTSPGCNLGSVANTSYKGTVALSLTPCPTAQKSQWTLDTQAYPFHDGANLIQVCASDFSTLGSPNTTCAPARSVNVDNSCTSSSVSGGELLSAQFAKSNRETLTVGFGEEAEVVGALQTNSGDPVSGATLCVKMQTMGIGSHPASVGTVQTDANGHYSYTVPAGPNREVVITYRHDTMQIARGVRYYAHSRPVVKAGPESLKNGKRVRLWGNLPGPRSEGRVVILQANVLGAKRWITFRKATTDERGHFHTNYHFTSTARPTVYRFRALVPQQADYPWMQGHSKPVKVRVTP